MVVISYDLTDINHWLSQFYDLVESKATAKMIDSTQSNNKISFWRLSSVETYELEVNGKYYKKIELDPIPDTEIVIRKRFNEFDVIFNWHLGYDILSAFALTINSNGIVSKHGNSINKTELQLRQRYKHHFLVEVCYDYNFNIQEDSLKDKALDKVKSEIIEKGLNLVSIHHTKCQELPKTVW